MLGAFPKRKKSGMCFRSASCLVSNRKSAYVFACLSCQPYNSYLPPDFYVFCTLSASCWGIYCINSFITTIPIWQQQHHSVQLSQVSLLSRERMVLIMMLQQLMHHPRYTPRSSFVRQEWFIGLVCCIVICNFIMYSTVYQYIYQDTVYDVVVLLRCALSSLKFYFPTIRVLWVFHFTRYNQQ